MSEEEFEKLRQALHEKAPKAAIHDLLRDVRDYVGFVNKIAEVLRLSDGIGEQQLDKDITVADVMLTLVRKGEKLTSLTELMHDYANQLEK